MCKILISLTRGTSHDLNKIISAFLSLHFLHQILYISETVGQGKLQHCHSLHTKSNFLKIFISDFKEKRNYLWNCLLFFLIIGQKRKELNSNMPTPWNASWDKLLSLCFQSLHGWKPETDTHPPTTPLALKAP